MSNVRPHPAMTNTLPSIHWPTMAGARNAAVLALLFQMESTQWLGAVEPHAQQTQANTVPATAYTRTHGKIYDIATSGSI